MDIRDGLMDLGFAQLLKQYRETTRISRSRLAESSGFDHSYVSRLESGHRMPTRDAVVKFADAQGALERMERRDVKGKLVLVP